MFKSYRVALAASALTLVTLPCWAASLQVAPTTIDLPAKGGNAVLYVSNSGTDPIGVHVEGFAWSQQDGADKLEPSPALQVSPPMTRLMPGQRQTIRVQVKPHSGTKEQAFRLMASEVPDATDKASEGVRVLFQFSVPVFAGDLGKTDLQHPHLAWHLSHLPSGSILTVQNSGPTHAKFSALKLVGSSGTALDVTHGRLIYVLAGNTEHWNVSELTVSPGEKLRVEGYDDRNRRAVSVPVVVGP